PWGESWGDGGSLASTGGVLLRQRQEGSEPQPIDWSSDGITWQPADFPDGSATDAYFDLSTAGVTVGDGVAYLRSYHNGQSGSSIWATTNGAEWQQLPEPPAGGPMIAVPDGLLVVSNSRLTEHECQDRA